MSMIFPGMDPYLEDPRLWPGFQTQFIVRLADHLTGSIRPRYFADIEVFEHWEGPLLPIKDSLVTILDGQKNQAAITAITLVSPANKIDGPGRDAYLAKQRELCQRGMSLVEIDILRAGIAVLPERIGKIPHDYLVSVRRGSRQGRFEIYNPTLRDRLPMILIPMADGDHDQALDIQEVLRITYERGYYRDHLNYSVACIPPLSPEDQEWANELIRQAMPPAE